MRKSVSTPETKSAIGAIVSYDTSVTRSGVDDVSILAAKYNQRTFSFSGLNELRDYVAYPVGPLNYRAARNPF